MSEPFIGEIKMFAGTFAPRGFALCQGQLLSIAQNSALFSLLGTTYGGDGRTTFGLPDMRGRLPLHVGQGTSLSNRPQGQRTGTQTETLTVDQLPTHNHGGLSASTTPATAGTPIGNVVGDTGTNLLYAEVNPNALLATTANQAVGGGQSHNNIMPFLGLNFIIALVGLFPSRN